MIFAACDPATESFGKMIHGICDGLFGAEYTGSTTTSSCVAPGGSCLDMATGTSYSCCTGLTCIPSNYGGTVSFTCAGMWTKEKYQDM